MDDLRLMRRSSPPHVKLKAAGGIRTLDAHDRSRRSWAATELALRGRPRSSTSSNRGWALEPRGWGAHSRFDLFGSGVRSHDQGVAEADEEAGVEHAGDALQAASRAIRGRRSELNRQSTI